MLRVGEESIQNGAVAGWWERVGKGDTPDSRAWQVRSQPGLGLNSGSVTWQLCDLAPHWENGFFFFFFFFENGFLD